jgi:asparagine synthase (glutamine-hydrolysing)
VCGFVAMIGLDGNKADPAVVERMSEVIKHRGPDEEGYYLSEKVGFGFRRLSILDLSQLGHQPMFSSDGQKVMVFNGEIYNYVELRKELESLGHTFKSAGDTEVLLNAYLQWGPECLRRFNGMWAFMIYDIEKCKLFGSRDRFGKKPLYRYQNGDQIFFASEIKAILSSGYYRGGPNWEVISKFLLTNEDFSRIEHDNQSFYSGIFQIPEGSAFELDLDGRFRVWRYWSLDLQVEDSITDPAESYYALFKDSVALRLRSDVPLGVFLSGGLDSTSVICALAAINSHKANVLNNPLTALSYYAPEFDESNYIKDTSSLADFQLVKYEPNPEHLWNSFEKFLYYQDEPVHTFSAVIYFELCQLAVENGLKVMLAGSGADEYLAGYFRYFKSYWYSLLRKYNLLEAWKEINHFCNVHGGNHWSRFFNSLRNALVANLHKYPLLRKIENRRKYNELHNNSWYLPELKDYLHMEDRGYEEPTLDIALRRSIERAPLPLYLRTDDRSTMAHSIEGRSPFLDYRLVSMAFQLPNNWKLRGPWNKYVLREAMRSRIPESVRTRPDKMGFPVAQKTWFSDFLYEPMRDLLDKQDFRERGIYNVKEIRRDLELHSKGEIDVSNRLFNLFQFEVWSTLGKKFKTSTP